MRRDRRRLGQLHDLVEGVVRDVGDVDHDAQSIHLGDHFATEGRKSLPLLLSRIGRVTDVIVLRVSQSDRLHLFLLW